MEGKEESGGGEGGTKKGGETDTDPACENWDEEPRPPKGMPHPSGSHRGSRCIARYHMSPSTCG